MKVLCFLPETLPFQNKLGMWTRSAGVDFQPCQNEAELLTFADNEKEKQFFVIADSKKYELLSNFSKLYPASKIIVVLLDSIHNQAAYFLDHDNIECFVGSNGGEFDARELLIMLKKFQHNKYLNLNKHLNFPAIFNGKKILTSTDKKNTLVQLENFILKIGGDSLRTKQYAQRVCDLADELLLNAIFNANPRLKMASKSLPFKLSEEEVIKIKWGFDGEVFGISVTDPFGTLSRKNILKYLDSRQKNESFSMRYEGGLGIKLIYERLHHYIVNVRENKMTEIICLMRFDKRFKDFESRLRSFHFFRIEEK